MDSATFAMMTVKHSVAHRHQLREKVITNQERKEPRKLGPPDVSVHTRTQGSTVQMCGDGNVAGKWVSGHYALGQQFQARPGRIQKPLHSWWKKKTAYPVAQIDDFVKHIFREYNEEADHLANLGTSGRRNIQLTEYRTQRTGKRSGVSEMVANKMSAEAAVAL